MASAHRTELDRNYDFFQRNLAVLLSEHRGEYALLKACEVVDFFESPGEAYRAGLERFSDELFSVQQVSEEPVQFGHMSVAID